MSKALNEKPNAEPLPAAASAGVILVACSFPSFAQNPQDCSKVPDYNKLKGALASAVKEGKGANGGLGNQEWGAVVNRDGVVCAVVFTDRIEVRNGP